MKITVIRSGGFAGIVFPAKVLETNDNNIFSLVDRVMSSNVNDVVVDGLVYDIKVEYNDGSVKNLLVKNQKFNNDIKSLIDLVMA